MRSLHAFLAPLPLVLTLAACEAGTTGSGGGGGGDGGSGGDSSGGETVSGGQGQGGFGPTTTTTTTGSTCPQNCTAITVGPCEKAVCNMQTYECDIVPLDDGTACDDGLFCTDGDTCEAGECVAGPPRDCGETTECGTASCNEQASACELTAAQNGTPCVSADLCLDPGNTFCQAGQCVGAPKDCGAQVVLQSPECQSPACDPSDGSCIVVPINDGIACTYGDICQSNKACNVGVCEGAPIMGCTACNETEANNTYLTANSGMGCASWAGAIATIGDKDFYRVDVPVAGSRIAASVVDVNGMGCPMGFDSVIRLYNAMGTEITSDDQSGVSPCSAFLASNAATTNLAAGTYYISVEDWLNNSTSPPYLLLVSVLPPGCGNGIVEAGEQCDDGNTLDGDTCSSTCQLTVFDCAMGDTQVTLSGTGLPLAIADNSTITNTIAVPNMGTVTKVAIEINITHTFDGDLDISIDAPAAAAEMLTNNNGSSGDNFTNTVFATGGTPIASGTAPFSGVFAPVGNFGNIVGTAANGNWVLSVSDTASLDTGTLNAWTLHLCVQ